MALSAPLPPALGDPHLSLLGGFSLAAADDLLELRRPAQRLLAYLAVHRDDPVPRQRLAERLWGDVDAAHAASSLRSALWRLPRPSGRQLVTATAMHLRMAPHVRVDLWGSEDSARALAERAAGSDGPDAAAYRDDDLCDLLSRDLLPDWDDEWLVVEQESYRQTRLHALENLSSTLRQAGRPAAALRAGLAAVRSEPLRETAHRRVIEVHLAEGNAAEALRQYQQYRRLLADELGLSPSPGIRRLVAPFLGRPMDGA